jgi:anthranilate phosphoribosyltransferase
MMDLVRAVSEGRDLTQEEAEAAFTRMMTGEASELEMTALLVALRTKGYAPSEVVGGVRALRKAMIPVPVPPGASVVDTCGTGGGSVTTFNISTAAALLVAGGDVPVAKHGNRSFTSRSGSADVLEALDVEIQLPPEGMGRILEETGIVFMFAPLLHPAIRHVGPVRRALGFSTIINLLGPITNPASARRQVVGVSDPELLPLVARALHALEHERALVVHGEAGLDEMSPLGPTMVAELKAGEVRDYRVDLPELGLEPARSEDIAGGCPEENARLILNVLEGKETGGARTATVLNAGAALYVGGAADSLKDGVELALEILAEGKGLRTLEALRDASRREGAEGREG